jgi:F0F1-type ATP synthase delta subunit
VDELMTALSEIDASSVPVDASQAEFTSSHKMDNAQRERLERLLSDKFRVNVKINEKVDESLMAGLVIKMGTLEIDGTLLNRYREAVAELKKAV